MQAESMEDSVKELLSQSKLANRIFSWDRTHMYSDQFLSHAAKEEKELIQLLKNLSCPYTLYECTQALHGDIIDLFIRDDKGLYYQQEWIDKKWNMYRPSEFELLTREKAEDIFKWLKDK